MQEKKMSFHLQDIQTIPCVTLGAHGLCPKRVDDDDVPLHGDQRRHVHGHGLRRHRQRVHERGQVRVQVEGQPVAEIVLLNVGLESEGRVISFQGTILFHISTMDGRTVAFRYGEEGATVRP